MIGKAQLDVALRVYRERVPCNESTSCLEALAPSARWFFQQPGDGVRVNEDTGLLQGSPAFAART